MFDKDKTKILSWEEQAILMWFFTEDKNVININLYVVNNISYATYALRIVNTLFVT